MPRRLAAATIAVLMLGGSILPAAAPPPHPALARGLALMRDGDFEAAVLELDAAARKIESDPAAERHRPWAYVYLGVAYLELEQEALARGKFREALARDPALRLEPADFSAQSIRAFEGVRAEAAAVVPPAASPPPASPARAVVPASEKKGSKGPLIAVLVGGAAAAGAAVALGGGGGESGAATTTTPGGNNTTLPAPSPSPSEPPSTTVPPGTPSPTVPPTTPPTNPTPAPACTYTVNGPTPPNPQLQIGSAGTCSVQTQPGCRWTAEANRPWIDARGSASGSGLIQFTLALNPDGGTRSGSIFLSESPSSSCPIQQRGLLSLQESTEQAAAMWISDLDLDGGAGQVTVDGSRVTYQAPGVARLAAPSGQVRIEAVVVAAGGRPGTWRFQIPSGAKPGSLRVVAGDVAAIAADTVLFRLAGRPGERAVFLFAQP